MRPSARTRANRLNAQRSTGPKTPSGKARSARNALKHGLSIPVEKLPAFDEEIEKYFCQIADRNMSRAAKMESRALALALVEIERVRHLRQSIYNSPLTRLKHLSSREVSRRLNAALKYYDNLVIYDRKTKEVIGFRTVSFEVDRLIKKLTSLEPEPISFEQGFANLAPMIAKLWRYERCALRRRDEAAQRLRILNGFNDNEMREVTIERI